MKTLLLVNMTTFADTYPEEIGEIEKAIETFARTHNAEVLDIGDVYKQKTGKPITIPTYPNPELTTMARDIKAEIISKTDGKLDYLILVGDEDVIPMWEIQLGRTLFHTDSFYSDLDGDGLPEVVTTRVLGHPDAMQRQLSEKVENTGPNATILCSEDTRIHLETQRFLDVLSQQGHEVEVLGRGGAECLSHSDLIIHFGHGSPKSLSNRFGENFVTAKDMPELSRQPIAIVDGCATTPPGSTLLRAFLNNGCRAYLGSTATVMGMVPARYTNQLVMHFLDTYALHPEWSVAKLLMHARVEYASVTGLSELLLELEQTGNVNKLVSDMRTHLLTFLEWHAYGSPFACLNQGKTQPVFAKHPLVESELTLEGGKQSITDMLFEIKSTDGQPILYLRADWLNSITPSIVIHIQQNGQVLHVMLGNTDIIYQHIENICVGGYVDGDLYHAYWLLPLQRVVGENRLRIELVTQKAGLTILPESVVEIWPEWETISAPEK